MTKYTKFWVNDTQSGRRLLLLRLQSYSLDRFEQVERSKMTMKSGIDEYIVISQLKGYHTLIKTIILKKYIKVYFLWHWFLWEDIHSICHTSCKYKSIMYNLYGYKMQIYSSIYLLPGKKSHFTVEKSVDVFQCHTTCYYQSKKYVLTLFHIWTKSFS